ncbi:hypothetical protein EXIGLDRAFT_717114, partial [Exidia glandulosa HHB12029]
MDHAALMSSLFGGMGGDPFMFLNLSGLCATTKLVQCKSFGIYQCDVTRKFYKSREEVPDIAWVDLQERKKVVEHVAEWVEQRRGGKARGDPREEWVPILYAYEIVKGSAKKHKDYGHLVFTNLTLTRFLLVFCFGPPSCRCGNPYHDDYDALTKLNADRWFSLCKYLWHDDGPPEWVKATYTTDEYFLDPSFLDSTVTPTPGTRKPGIYHVTEETFVPSLVASEIDRINNLLSQRSKDLVPPLEVRKAVEGRKRDRPNMTSVWIAGEESSPRQCAFCEKVGPQAMPTCSRCKLVRYCSKECQKAAWKTHKLVCKTPNDP